MQPRETAPRRGSPQREDAEILALRALHFMAETGALDRFCATSGMAPADLGALAADPDFLGAVLDFLLDDENQATAFCGWAEVSPEALNRARRLFPGATPLDS